MTTSEHGDHDRYTLAELLYHEGQYLQAAKLLEGIRADEGRSMLSVRHLLARALVRSAQLGRAEKVLREITTERPDDAYAHLLLGRVLQRQSRREEAEASLRLAEAMSPGITETAAQQPSSQEEAVRRRPSG